MKYYSIFLSVSISLILLVSCADEGRLDYFVDKPESVARLEYLNDYSELKTYIERNANPGFKLGAGVSVSDFTSKGLLYSLVCSNYDEMTAGWEMKHGAVVQSNGSLNLKTTQDFIAAAQKAGITIYGHTLCWHANQNANYLNSLLEPIIIPGTGGPTWDLVTSADFETDDNSNYEYNNNAKTAFTIVGQGSGNKGRALKITNEEVRTNDWDCQFFLKFSPNMKSGEKYKFSMDVRADQDATFGTQAHVVPYQYKHWNLFGDIHATTKWSTFEKEITITDELAGTGTIAFNLGKTATTYYFDHIVLEKYNEKGGNEPTDAGYAMELKNPRKQNLWEAQVVTKIATLSKGQKYVLTFVAKASDDCTLGTALQTFSGTYPSDNFPNFNLTKKWKKITVSTDVTDDTRTHLLFNFGDFVGTIYLDNVTLCKEGSTKNMIDNADFESGNIDGWNGCWNGVASIGISAEGKGFGNMGGEQIIEKTAGEKTEIITNELKRWIKGMMDVSKDYVKVWDVVNEPMADWPDPSKLKTGIGKPNMSEDEFYWQDYMGKDYARKAIEFAREYGGKDMVLFINDYGLESPSQEKCRGLIEYIKYLESDGITRVDGIGTQMHVTLKFKEGDQKTQEEAINKMFQSLAATGKLIKVSELDMGIEGEDGKSVKTENATFGQLQKQSEFYKFIIQSYFKHVPANQRYGITHWSPTDSPEKSGWRPNESIGLWDLNYNRKPAYAGFADGLAGK